MGTCPSHGGVEGCDVEKHAEQCCVGPTGRLTGCELHMERSQQTPLSRGPPRPGFPAAPLERGWRRRWGPAQAPGAAGEDAVPSPWVSGLHLLGYGQPTPFKHTTAIFRQPTPQALIPGRENAPSQRILEKPWAVRVLFKLNSQSILIMLPVPTCQSSCKTI